MCPNSHYGGFIPQYASKMIFLPLSLAPSSKTCVRTSRRKNRYKQDEIALRQLHALKEYQGPRKKPLRLSDVKAMFLEIKGIVG
jgi:hypothetical protein